MARYELTFKPSVAKDLLDIPRADVQRILARIETLRDDPRPPGCEKLSAQERYRVRQGKRTELLSSRPELLVPESHLELAEYTTRGVPKLPDACAFGIQGT
jgi:hypothetical protein